MANERSQVSQEQVLDQILSMSLLADHDSETAARLEALEDRYSESIPRYRKQGRPLSSTMKAWAEWLGVN